MTAIRHSLDQAPPSRLRGFGPVGILAILVIIAADVVVKPLSAIMILGWARATRTPWREIGFTRPRSWVMAVGLGLIVGVALKFALKTLVMPLLGAPPANQAYQFLQGNGAALPRMLYAILVGAAFGEEVMFRGFMFARIRQLVGEATRATAFTLILTSLIFGLVHYPNQGWPGVQQSIITGLVFGLMYLRSGSLAAPMIAHAAFDLTALWMIYNGLETRIATIFFG